MAPVRFVLNHAGVREVMKSAEMMSMLLSRADRVMAAAEGFGVQVQTGSNREPMPYKTEVFLRSTRAVAICEADHPAGLAAEAKYGTLTSSTDAAAG